MTFYETIIIVFTLNKEIIEKRIRRVCYYLFNRQSHAADLLHETALNAMREIDRIWLLGQEAELIGRVPLAPFVKV